MLLLEKQGQAGASKWARVPLLTIGTSAVRVGGAGERVRTIPARRIEVAQPGVVAKKALPR